MGGFIRSGNRCPEPGLLGGNPGLRIHPKLFLGIPFALRTGFNVDIVRTEHTRDWSGGHPDRLWGRSGLGGTGIRSNKSQSTPKPRWDICKRRSSVKFSFKKWAFVPALTLSAALVGCQGEDAGEETPPAPEPGAAAPAETKPEGEATEPVEATTPETAAEEAKPEGDMPAEAAAPPSLEGPGEPKVEESPTPETEAPAEAPKEEEKPAEEPKA